VMAAAQDDTFSRHMEAVARLLFGDPNKQLSSAAELRFGAHGSMSIDLERGVWTDHEAKEGGGVLDLVMREKRIEKGAAIEWLKAEVGIELEDRRQPERGVVKPFERIVATYDYVDEHGEVLFQAVRYEPKNFRQRRPDPESATGWSWSVKGVRQVPYRLSGVLAAIASGEPVFIVEGEKDADNLAKEGLTATCNAMGAGKWPAELSPCFAGADVVILRDNDEAGAQHTELVASEVAQHAKRVRALDLPGLPPKGDVSDWLARGGDKEQLLALVERDAKVWTPEPPVSRFGAIGFNEATRTELNYPPLIKGLIYQGDKAMVFGESGSGKSFLCVDIALAIARGVPFLGMKTTRGAVLYQAGEGGKGLIKRLKAYSQEHRVADEPRFKLLPAKVDLFAQDGDTEAFITECRAWRAWYQSQGIPLLLIVIDTFSAASPGANENASEDMGRMLAAGDRINQETGAAVAWVHHKNATGLRERGHTSFRANIETAIEVRRDPETKERTLHLAKLKDGEDGLRLGFELQSVTIGTDDDGDPITSCVVRPAQVGTAQTSKRNRLPKGQHDFIRVLDTAICQWGGVVPGVDAYGVSVEKFKELYVSICGYERSGDAIRTAVNRDLKELRLQELVVKKEDWLWITDKGGRML